MAIVEDKVKPERISKDAKKYPKMVFEWWKHWNPRPELRASTAKLDRVLAISRVGQQASIAVSSGWNGIRGFIDSFPVRILCSLRSPPVPTPRNLGQVLRFLHEGRLALYAL